MVMFLEIALSLAGAGFSFLGLYALGAIFSLWTSLQFTNEHGKVALGFGLYYVLFVTLSLLLSPLFVWYSLLVIFVFSISFQRKPIFGYVSNMKLKVPFLGLLLVLFLPYLFKFMSPPVSDDGLSFYLPSVAWIYAHGLEFNPYLTNYTTMPQGVEYLFSLPFGLTGIGGIRALDALGAFGLVHLLYSSGKQLFSEPIARILVLSSLLIKGTLFFIFASGKIDTWSTYILVVGIVLFLQSYRSGKVTEAFLVFSISLGIKYTNWLILLLPLCYLLLILFRDRKSWRIGFLALVPLFFIGSVTIRNQILVNSPLAPLLKTGQESRYIGTHGGIPIRQTQEVMEMGGSTMVPFFNQVMEFLTHPLLVILILVISAGVFWIRKVTISGELAQGLVLAVLMLLPWFLIFGFSDQPLRFIWAPLILGLILLLKLIEELYAVKAEKLILFQHTALLVLSLTALTVIYSRHSFYISNYFQLSDRTLPDWYSLADKDHYSISYRFKELGLHHRSVHYRVPVALGAFDVGDYGTIPEHEELEQMMSSDAIKGEFVIDKGQEKLDSLAKEDILIHYGDYFVYQLRK
ncbi:MAG: hypothetical protein ACI9UV_002889 [Algoriphagus sp.]|jgi:hypothetical protein